MGRSFRGGGKQGGGETKGEGRGEVRGPEGSNLFYNKIGSSNLSRTGLWDPQRAPPHTK